MKDFIRISGDCLIRKSDITYFSSEYHNSEYSGKKFTKYLVRIQLLNKSTFTIREKKSKFEININILKAKEKEFFDEVLKEMTLLMNTARKEI